MSLVTRLTPNTLLKDYEVYAKDWANILRQSKTDLEQYEKEIWKIAAEYPDFQPQAQEIQNRLLLLKAAEQDAWTAREELKYLENPELRPKIEMETETTATPKSSTNTDAYKKTLEDIKQKLLELKSPYEQAMTKADEWRANALKIWMPIRLIMKPIKNRLRWFMTIWLKKPMRRRLILPNLWKMALNAAFGTFRMKSAILPAWLKMRLKTLFPVWKTLLRVLSLQEK